MFRRTTTLDPTLTHLWRDDTHTECGLQAEQLANATATLCAACLDQYGLELAMMFSKLQWLGTIAGMTLHAFDPDADVDKVGRLWPVCHIRSYQPAVLAPRPYRMRCPHCLNHLRNRNEGPFR